KKQHLSFLIEITHGDRRVQRTKQNQLNSFRIYWNHGTSGTPTTDRNTRGSGAAGCVPRGRAKLRDSSLPRSSCSFSSSNGDQEGFTGSRHLRDRKRN